MSQDEVGDIPHPVTALFDQTSFRSVLSHFVTGVVIVTGQTAAGDPAGLTCQSFSSLSLDPPLVMVCPSKSSKSWPRILASKKFAVNILGDHQRELGAAFARSGTDKFAVADWEWSNHDLPLLTGSLASIESNIYAVHDGGDHHIVVGDVLDMSVADTFGSGPLVYFRSSYHAISRR